MGTLWEYIVVFTLAAIPWFEIAAVIPLGILRGLQPVAVAAVAFFGNLSTIVLLIYLYEKAKSYLDKKKGPKTEEGKRGRRAKRIWNKYGLPGLAMLGPVLIGIHIAAFIGLSLGAKKNWVLLWMTVSLVIWSVVFGFGSYYGIEGIKLLNQ